MRIKSKVSELGPKVNINNAYQLSRAAAIDYRTAQTLWKNIGGDLSLVKLLTWLKVARALGETVDASFEVIE